MHCRICGDEKNVAFRGGNRGYLCFSCFKDTPVKIGFEEFVRIYFEGEEVNYSLAHEFYDDYRCSTLNLQDYIEKTSFVC